MNDGLHKAITETLTPVGAAGAIGEPSPSGVPGAVSVNDAQTVNVPYNWYEKSAWSKEPPKVAGTWWMRGVGSDGVVYTSAVEVYLRGGEWRYLDFGEEQSCAVDDEKVEWAKATPPE
jgi:hypothetical protein